MSSLSRYGLFLLPLMLTLTFLACSEQADSTADNKTAVDSAAIAAPIDSLVITLVGVDSVSVLNLLQTHHTVDIQESSMGAFVKAIDSVENAGGYFWLYSVNDSAGKV
ncbi:MAG: DUF4430 domain-containing protein, partial [bacterium]|nr:DUF4430 domain-containing protein [bacterium]